MVWFQRKQQANPEVEELGWPISPVLGLDPGSGKNDPQGIGSLATGCLGSKAGLEQGGFCHRLVPEGKVGLPEGEHITKHCKAYFFIHTDIKTPISLGAVVHVFNPGTQEARAVRSHRV